MFGKFGEFLNFLFEMFWEWAVSAGFCDLDKGFTGSNVVLCEFDDRVLDAVFVFDSLWGLHICLCLPFYGFSSFFVVGVSTCWLDRP